MAERPARCRTWGAFGCCVLTFFFFGEPLASCAAFVFLSCGRRH